MGKMKAGQDPSRSESHDQQDNDIAERLSHIQHKILVMSGKGGVGKSSVASYLSVSLARRGFKVGLMDVDLHGPSIPHILGISGRLQADAATKKASPFQFLPNLEVVSIKMLLGEKDAAVVWRGPLKGGVIRQFISDIQWDDLDYLIIDSPPGTGDEPLTVAQTIPDSEALIVTTPQEVALADVRKSINFCRQVNMDILGMVENMNGLQCPHCGKIIDVFQTFGGELTAEREHLTLLASLPLDPEVVKESDHGDVKFLEDPDRPITHEFNKMVDKVISLHDTADATAMETVA